MAKLPKLYRKYRYGHQKWMGYSDFWFNQPTPSIYEVPKLNETFSAEEKLTQLTEPWNRLKIFNDKYNPTASRLPEYYKKFYWEWKHAPKTPVHVVDQKGNFRLSLDGTTVEEVHTDEVQVVYPREVDQGLWGGEGVVKGYKNLGRYKGEVARYWFPHLQKTAVYSDILDRYVELHATERALDLIDDATGLDHYILQTSHADLNSLLAFRLKREMLLALLRGTVPGDEERRQRVLQTYGHYASIPEEEADWLGLSLEEAVRRQEAREEEARRPLPYKADFRSQLVAYLEEAREAQRAEEAHAKREEEESSWIGKYNPFKSGSTTKEEK